MPWKDIDSFFFKQRSMFVEVQLLTMKELCIRSKVASFLSHRTGQAIQEGLREMVPAWDIMRTKDVG